MRTKQEVKPEHYIFDLELYKQEFKRILVDYTNLSLEVNPIGEGDALVFCLKLSFTVVNYFSGAFGKVYRGNYLQHDRDVAFKTIKSKLVCMCVCVCVCVLCVYKRLHACMLNF